MTRLSTKDVLCDQGQKVASNGSIVQHGTGGMVGHCVSREAPVLKGIGLKEAAQEAGLSVACLRRYILEGWLQPDKVTIPGGYQFSFRERDIQRSKEIASWNLDWLKTHRKGLYEYFGEKALSQGRRLPAP